MNNCDKSENHVRQLKRKIQNSISELTNSAAMYLTLSNDLRRVGKSYMITLSPS